MKEKLTDENFLIFCAKHYDNPQAMSTEEFLEDLERIKYIKKLINRYVESGDLKERLILNHIVTLYNCFGHNLAKILFLKLENQFRYVKPFLVMINMIPAVIYNVGTHEKVLTDLIDMDSTIINALRKINTNDSKN
jgi:hypothetical protein